MRRSALVWRDSLGHAAVFNLLIDGEQLAEVKPPVKAIRENLRFEERTHRSEDMKTVGDQTRRFYRELGWRQRGTCDTHVPLMTRLHVRAGRSATEMGIGAGSASEAGTRVRGLGPAYVRRNARLHSARMAGEVTDREKSTMKKISFGQ